MFNLQIKLESCLRVFCSGADMFLSDSSLSLPHHIWLSPSSTNIKFTIFSVFKFNVTASSQHSYTNMGSRRDVTKV